MKLQWLCFITWFDIRFPTCQTRDYRGVCNGNGSLIICCIDYYKKEDVCVECEPGYIGFNCSHRCPMNYYGRLCRHRCDCSPDKYCDPVRGCVCKHCRECEPGYQGINCSGSCPKNYYGRQCRHRCDCSSDRYCDHGRGCLCKQSSVNCTDQDDSDDTVDDAFVTKCMQCVLRKLSASDD